MDDPTSPLSGRRPTLRRLRRAASNGGNARNGGGQAKLERPDDADSRDGPLAREWLRNAPSSATRPAAAAAAAPARKAVSARTTRAAVERKEEIVIDNDDEDEDVPLPVRRHFQPPSRSPVPDIERDSGDSDDEAACSICLGQPADPALLDSCSHSFCFLCIFRWCTDICNNCPLCKRRVTQIAHRGDAASTAGSPTSAHAAAVKKEAGAKQKQRSEAEERKQEEEDADDAADDWAVIQTQRAENQMKAAARRRGRQSAQLSQLSLEASPTSLADGIDAIAAMDHSQPVPLTRQKVKQIVAEQQQIIGRTHSNSTSQSARPSSLLSLRRSSSNSAATAASSASSSPVSVSALTSPASAQSPSPLSSPAAMLVVHIADKQQRASYDEADDEVPSPSILNIACELCFTDENEHLLLLCDGCNDAYHTYCLEPRLDSIPENEWFCVNCLGDAQAQADLEHKAVSDIINSDFFATRPRAFSSPSLSQQGPNTPRRGYGRAQRLGARTSPAVRGRLTLTPQSADPLDEEYTPSSGPGRFDSAPIPLSFVGIRPPAPRALNQRRSVRQEQLRRQVLESQREQQEEQTRLRAERAAKRRADRTRHRYEDDESDDDFDYRSLVSSAAASSAPHAASAPTAPLSSLHQLSSSQGETLAQKLRAKVLARVKERDDEREREAAQLGQSGFIERMLDAVVQQKAKESSTEHREDGRRHRSKRKAQEAECGEDQEEDWSGGGGRVRRKAANKSQFNTEPIIVPSSASSSVQAAASAMSSVASHFPSHPTRSPNVTPALSSAARLSPFSVSHSPTSSPPSSLHSLPYASRPSSQLADSGTTAVGSRAAAVNLAASLSVAAAHQPSIAVVPPARYPYTAPVIPRRPAAPPPASSSPPSTMPSSQVSWHRASAPVLNPAPAAAPTAPAPPSIQPFEDFERASSRAALTRSPFRAAPSPQQHRQHSKHAAVEGDKRRGVAERAALPMRRSIFTVVEGKHDSEYFS